jgi:hypothetical protein
MHAIDPTVSESVLGVLSAEFADKARANLRVLAFQQRGQKKYDSNEHAADKANVRASKCKQCTGPADCSAPTKSCNYGFCEAGMSSVPQDQRREQERADTEEKDQEEDPPVATLVMSVEIGSRTQDVGHTSCACKIETRS